MSRGLIALRHGQTSFNADRRMQGQYNSQLSDEGRAQAQAIAQHLAPLNITRVISSDLDRAHDTARIVARELAAILGGDELPITTDERLRETNLGQWQGVRVPELDETQPGVRAIWRHDPSFAPPEGESRLQVAARARAVIDELMDNEDTWDGNRILVVAHGGTICALTAALLGLGEAQYPLLSGLNNAHYAALLARPPFDEANPTAPLSFTGVAPGDVTWYLEAWNKSGGLA